MDPVYPFGDETPVPLPPFLTPGGGLKTDGLTLSVQTVDPLTVTYGGVGLKIGDGLEVEGGKLVSTAGRLTVIPPLQQSASGEVSLSTDSTFSVDSKGALSLPLENSLVSKSTGLTVNPPVAPISLNSDGKLQLGVDSAGPLKVEEDVLKMKYDTTLSVNTSLALGLKNPITPIQLTDYGALTFKAGNSLAVASDGLVLVDPKAPLKLNTAGQVELKLGDGLTVEEDALAVSVLDKTYSYRVGSGETLREWGVVYKEIVHVLHGTFFFLTTAQTRVKSGDKTFDIPVTDSLKGFLERAPLPLAFFTFTAGSLLGTKTPVGGFISVDNPVTKMIITLDNAANNYVGPIFTCGHKFNSPSPINPTHETHLNPENTPVGNATSLLSVD